MSRNIFFLTVFFVVTTVAIPFALLALPLRLLKLRGAERFYVAVVARTLSKIYLLAGGARVEIRGAETLRGLRGKPLCVVSNHQGMADIPVIVASMPFSVGFVAKKSLYYFPWVGIMMWALRCVPIDRSSPRSAMKAIERGVVNIRKGYPMMIFPEGTRSRGDKMGNFKKGSLKLATRADALILPITLDGTYRLLEAQGTLRPAAVRMTVHSPVSTAGLGREEIGRLLLELESTIASALESEEN